MDSSDAKMTDSAKLRTLNRGTRMKTDRSEKTTQLSNGNSQRVTIRFIEIRPAALRRLVPMARVYYQHTEIKMTFVGLLQLLICLLSLPTMAKFLDLKSKVKEFPWKASSRTVPISCTRRETQEIDIHANVRRVFKSHGYRNTDIVLPLSMFFSEKSIEDFFKGPSSKVTRIKTTVMSPATYVYHGLARDEPPLRHIVDQEHDFDSTDTFYFYPSS